MNPIILQRVGIALYGTQWKPGLARDLKCSPRTLRRWANDRQEMPRDLPTRLLRLVQQRGEALKHLAQELSGIQLETYMEPAETKNAPAGNNASECD